MINKEKFKKVEIIRGPLRGIRGLSKLNNIDSILVVITHIPPTITHKIPLVPGLTAKVLRNNIRVIEGPKLIKIV